MKKIYRAISLVLSAAIIIAFAGCQREVTAQSLTESVTAENVPERACDNAFANRYNNFALKLLKNMYSSDSNTVISPLAVLQSLSLAANGADGNTRAEIEKAFSDSFTVDDLNVYLHTYIDRLKNSDTTKLYLENSMWFNSDNEVTVSNDFLQTNANYYNASIFKDSFTSSAVQNINNWMANETQENVSFVIRAVPEDATAYMVNAASLVAEWEKPYSYDQVNDGEFNAADGSKQKAQMMTSYDYVYLADEMVEGFMKYYSGKNYALVVLCPLESYNNLQNVVDYLDYNRLRELFKGKKNEVVHSTIPKFECDYSGNFAENLEALGISTAFNSNSADFSKIGESENKIYLGDIFTKAYIRVTEKGTNAGTAASVSNSNDTASRVHEFNVDRPFVYMVVDCNNYLPILIGAINTLE